MMPPMARSVMRRRGHETVRQGPFPVRLAFRIRTAAGREFLPQTRARGETGALSPGLGSIPTLPSPRYPKGKAPAAPNATAVAPEDMRSTARTGPLTNRSQAHPPPGAPSQRRPVNPYREIGESRPSRRLSKRFAPCGSSRAGAGCGRRKRHRFQFQNIRPGAMSGSARFSRAVDANPPIFFRLCEMQVPRLAPFGTDPRHSVAQRMPDAAFGRSLWRSRHRGGLAFIVPVVPVQSKQPDDDGRTRRLDGE